MSCCESSCSGCQKSCSGCSPALYLTEVELKLLRRFGETPFLPVARQPDGETPVCLEEGTGEQETVSNGILALERKGLIDLDYNLPLQNFDYGPYAAWSRQGSMALTVRGQEVLDVLDIQGVENEDEE